jgi:RES domain
MEQKVLCSECFLNAGLRIEAAHFGDRGNEPCQNCSSRNGCGLGLEALEQLVTRFFVDGSRSPYLPPVYRIDRSKLATEPYVVGFDETVQRDYELIAGHLETLRYNAPSPRKMGISGPFSDFIEALGSPNEEGDRIRLAEVAADVLGRCALAHLEREQKVYRIRTNPELIQNSRDIDTPPSQIGSCKKGNGRFETESLPILYASSDVETALHESRVRLGDEIVLGTLEVCTQQKLVDLDDVKQDLDGYRDTKPDYYYFLRGRLDSQRPIDYQMCQSLAIEARRAGFDGLKFRSFYSILREDHKSSVNYALFGFPIAAGKLKLISWNSIRLLRVSYDFQFGPLPHTLWQTKP